MEKITIKERRQAIKESIKHHLRMARWVRTQPPDDPPNCIDMRTAIKESWGAGDCNLCKLYNLIYRDKCIKCPLYKRYGQCNRKSVKNAYYKLHKSFTWKEWLKHNLELRRQLRSLL